MDFKDALNVKVDEIERPPLAPVGHYKWKVTRTVFGEVGGGKWDTVDFTLQALEAEDDVDPDDLSKVGGINSVRQRLRFMFNKADDEEGKANFARTLYNMKRFLSEHLGMGTEGSLREQINNSIGNVCMGNIRHRQDPDDPETFYAEIDRTAPVA